MYTRINKSVLDTELPKVFEEFANVLTKLDSRELKLYLFQQAYDAIVDAIYDGYYIDSNLIDAPNYSEICEWCKWPDLQDNGIFERAINAAWNVARYSHDLKPMEACVKSRGERTI